MQIIVTTDISLDSLLLNIEALSADMADFINVTNEIHVFD